MRIYRALELNLSIKPRKRLVRERLEPLAMPQQPNRTWLMNFMADGLAFPTLNVIDDVNRERLGIEVVSTIASCILGNAAKQRSGASP